MHSPLRQQLLDQVLHIIEQARPLVEAVARRDRDLGSLGRLRLRGGDARLGFDSARGSLFEAQAGLRLAVAWGYLSGADCAQVLAALDRLGARVFGLIRR